MRIAVLNRKVSMHILVHNILQEAVIYTQLSRKYKERKKKKKGRKENYQEIKNRNKVNKKKLYKILNLYINIYV